MFFLSVILTVYRHSSLGEDTFTHQWRQRDRYTIPDWHTTPNSVSHTRVPWATLPGDEFLECGRHRSVYLSSAK